MKKKKERISIITTFYNDENVILMAVESVHQQVLTNKNLEIEYILVNDNSNDNSLQILNLFLAKFENERKDLYYNIVTTPKNLGCGGARKFGIEHAHGDYFMFLDADDYYLNNNFVQNAYDTITSEKADIVEYGIIFNLVNGKKQPHVVQQKITITDPSFALKLMFRDGLIKFNVWSKIYKKEIVQSHEYSDVREYEDIRTIPYWVYNAKKIVIMPSLEINYRASEKSIIRSNMLETRLKTVEALCEMMNVFPSDIYWDIYDRAMIDMKIVLEGHSSLDPGFNEMSKYNTEMLKHIFPNDYKNLTFNIEETENK